MRRVVLLMLAGAIATGLAAPAVGEPNVRRQEGAYAGWEVKTDERDRWKWYGAVAFRDAAVVGGGEGDAYWSSAYFFKGECTRSREGGAQIIFCLAKHGVRADLDKDFYVSPTTDRAELKTRHKGQSFTMTWTAKGRPGLYQAGEGCTDEEGNDGEGAGGGVWREAHAKGRMFGRTFASGRAEIVSGAMFSTCSFRSIDYDPETGVLRVTTRLPG